MYPLLFELGPVNIYSYGVLLGGAYLLPSGTPCGGPAAPG